MVNFDILIKKHIDDSRYIEITTKEIGLKKAQKLTQIIPKKEATEVMEILLSASMTFGDVNEGSFLSSLADFLTESDVETLKEYVFRR